MSGCILQIWNCFQYQMLNVPINTILFLFGLKGHWHLWSRLFALYSGFFIVFLKQLICLPLGYLTIFCFSLINSHLKLSKTSSPIRGILSHQCLCVTNHSVFMMGLSLWVEAKVITQAVQVPYWDDRAFWSSCLWSDTKLRSHLHSQMEIMQ